MQKEINDHSQLDKKLVPPVPGYEFPGTNLIRSDDFIELLSLVPDNPDVLNLILGKKEDYLVQDLSLWHNIIIGGTTGSGKTQFLYDQISYWLFRKTTEHLKIFIFGSKEVNYDVFKKLNICVVDNENDQYNQTQPCRATILSLISECNERSSLFRKAGVRNKKDYNKEFKDGKIRAEDGHRLLQDIVLIIDDLTAFFTVDIAQNLMALSAINLNVGVYIILATSQISLPAINASFLSNFIFRIAFRTMSEKESKKILDYGGAEKIMEVGGYLIRDWGKTRSLKTTNISYNDIFTLVDFVAIQEKKIAPFEFPKGEVKLEVKKLGLEDFDSLIEEAALLIVMHQQGLTSLIQRKLKLGYNRAGRIMDNLESLGIVGPFEGGKARKVLILDEYALESFLDDYFGEKRRPISKPITKGVSRKVVIAPRVEILSKSGREGQSKASSSLGGAEKVVKRSFWSRLFSRSER